MSDQIAKTKDVLPDAEPPNRLISDQHCVNCGHLYFDHLVSMNTKQTGECKHCKCFYPETASRERLWKEFPALQEQVERLTEAIESAQLSLCQHCGTSYRLLEQALLGKDGE